MGNGMPPPWLQVEPGNPILPLENRRVFCVCESAPDGALEGVPPIAPYPRVNLCPNRPHVVFDPKQTFVIFGLVQGAQLAGIGSDRVNHRGG